MFHYFYYVLFDSQFTQASINALKVNAYLTVVTKVRLQVAK